MGYFPATGSRHGNTGSLDQSQHELSVFSGIQPDGKYVWRMTFGASIVYPTLNNRSWGKTLRCVQKFTRYPTSTIL